MIPTDSEHRKVRTICPHCGTGCGISLHVADRQFVGVSLDPHPGVTKLSALNRILEGSIRAVYIMGENTNVSDANASKSRRALEAVGFLVVQDIFLTETAEYKTCAVRVEKCGQAYLVGD